MHRSDLDEGVIHVAVGVCSVLSHWSVDGLLEAGEVLGNISVSLGNEKVEADVSINDHEQSRDAWEEPGSKGQESVQSQEHACHVGLGHLESKDGVEDELHQSKHVENGNEDAESVTLSWSSETQKDLEEDECSGSDLEGKVLSLLKSSLGPALHWE